MKNEDNIHGERRGRGRIEVICGSMFSGKTEELIRRMKRAKFARQKVEIYKPVIDTRYSKDDVVSHDHNAITSSPVDSSAAILLLSEDIDVVGIDEAQFFDDGLVEVCNQLADKGIRVIVAGLDMDYKGKPFGPIPVSVPLPMRSRRSMPSVCVAEPWPISATVWCATTTVCSSERRTNMSLSAVTATIR